MKEYRPRTALMALCTRGSRPSPSLPLRRLSTKEDDVKREATIK